MIELTGKTILAPMAGLTDPVFRRLCRKAGADIVLTEMVSAEGLHWNSKKTEELCRIHPDEYPIGLQLFGSDPQKLADAVKRVVELSNPSYVDLNCGCPVAKVTGKNGGSSLLKEPKLFEEIVTAMVKATTTPITVKIRSGWNIGEWVDTEFARIAEGCGVQAIAVHPRSRSMGYTGHAFWDRIAAVKQAVTIPVIGNGDIKTGADAVRMYAETGCDAVMLARGTNGNPWIFNEIKAALANQPAPVITHSDTLAMAQEHVKSYADYYGEEARLGEMKKHLSWYFKGFPSGAPIRDMLNRAVHARDLQPMFALIEQEIS